MMKFPADFIWGAASAAYQIEGHDLADGGGASIWRTFSHTPGKVAWEDNGDIACDAYYRFEEDLDLLAKTGAKAYRFSTSWSRVDPLGDGNWNEKGLAYYDRLVNACLDRGLTPFMTLYHWELPQALEDRGGWQVRETAEAFGRFAAMMAEHFKGRVQNYFTLNEPQCSVSLGYEQGIHAPGKKLPREKVFACLLNQMLAHGYALRAIKAADLEAVVGLASTGNLCYPAEETPENIAAAREATFSTNPDFWVFTHHWLLDPICLGRFPHAPGTWLEEMAAAVSPEDLEIIHAVPDMLGYNIYNGHEIRLTDTGWEFTPRGPGYPRTGLKWPVTEGVLNWGVRFVQERYGLPGFITENGLSCNDKIYLDGQVHDLDRIDFLTRYLRELGKAVESGCGIKGYFHWSLTDNFEWHSGYSDRFGIIFVDYETQKRIPKDSYHWYSKVIGTGEV
jgi:beta-glucosidase